MTEYMLVLHDDPSAFEGMSPEEMQKVIQEYGKWAGELSAKGKLAEGRKLTDEPGLVLQRNSDKMVVRDGPFSESSGPVQQSASSSTAKP